MIRLAQLPDVTAEENAEEVPSVLYVRLPKSLHDEASKLAHQSRISLNKWCVNLIRAEIVAEAALTESEAVEAEYEAVGGEQI